MFCRTKSGTLRLVHEGEEILLDIEGRELPDELGESIRTHVNVIAGEKPAPAEPAKKKPGPAAKAPDPE